MADDPVAVGEDDELIFPHPAVRDPRVYEDQPSVFAAADLLERELPNARKVVMHGTAHVPNMERPEEFNRNVLDFLRDYH